MKKFGRKSVRREVILKVELWLMWCCIGMGLFCNETTGLGDSSEGFSKTLIAVAAE